MNKFLILILLSFGFQTDWLGETKRLISETDKNSIIVNTKIIEDKDGKIITTEYNVGEINKTKVHLVHTELIDVELNIYEKDSFLLAEIMNGKDVLIYKRKRLKNEPYATLINSRTYFKSETEGVNLIRKVNIYETDNIEDLKEKLKTMEFETRNLNADDYNQSRKRFNRMISNTDK